MSRIDDVGFGRLLRRLRVDGGSRSRAVAARESAASGAPFGKLGTAAPASGLRAELAARLAGIDLRRKEAEARAVEIFVSCVLSREFGEALMASVPGQDLLRQVRAALLAVPEARAAVVAMLRTLAAPREV